jgi:hypothetical protein
MRIRRSLMCDSPKRKNTGMSPEIVSYSLRGS